MSLKLLLLAALLVLIFGHRLSAAESVSGIVVDEQNKPVAGIPVKQTGLKGVAVITGADGTFTQNLEFPLLARTTDGTKQAYYERTGNEDTRVPLRLVLKPAQLIHATVLDAANHPVEGAWVGAAALLKTRGESVTNAAGKAALYVPAEARLDYLVAMKEGVGLDYRLVWRAGEPHLDPYRLDPDFKNLVTFVLNGSKSVALRAVDEEGKPLAGASVYPWLVEKPQHGALVNLAGLEAIARYTNAGGVAEFNMVPTDNLRPIIFWVDKDGYTSPERWVFDPAAGRTEIVARLLPLVRLNGRVLDEQDNPVTGVIVRVGGAGPKMGAEFQCKEVQTDKDGFFGINVFPDEYYLLAAQKGPSVSRTVNQIVRAATPDLIKLVLGPGCRVYGKITAGPGSMPVPGTSVSLSLQDNLSYRGVPKSQQFSKPEQALIPVIYQTATSGIDGTFEFYVPPGRYYLNTYVSGNRLVQSFDIINQKELEVTAHSEAPLAKKKIVHGTVMVAGTPPTPVAAAVIESVPDDDPSNSYLSLEKAISDKDGHFEVTQSSVVLRMFAATPDQKLVGSVTLKPTDEQIILSMAPAATGKGRLLDTNGRPAPGRVLLTRITARSGVGGQCVTNEKGEFTLLGMIPGQSYMLNIVTKTSSEGWPSAYRAIGNVMAKEPRETNLGEFKITAPSATEPR